MTKCLNCNNNKSSVVGFVVRGVFCDRTTVRGTPPSINDKYPWFVAKNIGRKICLCKDCGLLLSRDVNSNIVGFLTEREYKCYQHSYSFFVCVNGCEVDDKMDYMSKVQYTYTWVNSDSIKNLTMEDSFERMTLRSRK